MRKIVLLIDAENVSYRFAGHIIKYLEKKGTIIYKKSYGDFCKSDKLKGWYKTAEIHQIEIQQVTATVTGKNASDIKLVIDAMDFLYKNIADTYCIVTSDGDFTDLIKRIRQEGRTVIGMGKIDASKRLEKVCDEFVNFTELVMANEGNKMPRIQDNAIAQNRQITQKQPVQKQVTPKQPEPKKAVQPKKGKSKVHIAASLSEITEYLKELVIQDEKEKKCSDLGGIKSRLQLRYPGFTEKDYGYKSLQEMISEETEFRIYQNGTRAYVSRAHRELDDVFEQIKKAFPDGTINLAQIADLGNMIRSEHPDFDYKMYGYTKLSLILTELNYKVI